MLTALNIHFTQSLVLVRLNKTQVIIEREKVKDLLFDRVQVTQTVYCHINELLV